MPRDGHEFLRPGRVSAFDLAQTRSPELSRAAVRLVPRCLRSRRREGRSGRSGGILGSTSA
eukprot:13811536-Alexandrium_andersonii.AAC.1